MKRTDANAAFWRWYRRYLDKFKGQPSPQTVWLAAVKWDRRTVPPVTRHRSKP